MFDLVVFEGLANMNDSLSVLAVFSKSWTNILPVTIIERCLKMLVYVYVWSAYVVLS